MPDFTIKQENINNYHIDLTVTNRNGYTFYVVTLAVDYGNTGLYSTVRDYKSPVKRNALITYARYKKSILN